MAIRTRGFGALGLMILVTTGCSTVGESLGFSTPTNPLSKNAKAVRDTAPVPAPVPRELAMSLLPAHIVEAGDTLLVQPVELDAPVRLPPDQPVQPDGTIDLGQYGRPVVAGKTLPEVEAVVRDTVAAKEKKAVPMTVRLLARPGKVFYVLGEVNAPGAFPVTGHDTVLSAITQAGGPTRRASLQNIIVARPSLPDGCRTVLPVCYTNIVQLGDTSTNYQLLPGDRIFVPSKGTFEDLFGGYFKRGGPCDGPQVSCFSGNCNPACGGLPTVPAPKP
ncbi:SLBB domain protein [Gemmata sp. SH-PL17]|uniref:polysaccharide biosynthesis/export family protein n=1 Tax=Gemmata sp. SH-PL17 TaxID=1630693 RepID=UPI00078D5A8D|nr:SLBB domain-containing protein [Gemmata sp. SH-PL17]AMV25374.1 SLBB domain protein [Gemmata sp. SH-PL17]